SQDPTLSSDQLGSWEKTSQLSALEAEFTQLMTSCNKLKAETGSQVSESGQQPFLSQHSRQAELPKDAAIGEPRDRGDVVALEGQHKERECPRDVSLGRRGVAGE